ncbi:hypothetical protein [Absicoccus intestinalis]|uniref:Uncharacterized protein n=1 Tax=Absicoccus intestinalis TaxID=2926319 RepID=A0ABU4WND3_9FIRM|nr:hypothetical protein [Absicoccus sp. CLA-KB-P134]MDX8417536.1 hypothetical protein [Absicoccus sp. CLA-KB-P134]
MAKKTIPDWVYQCLDQYGNCACGRNLTKKLGKEGLIQELEANGYPCELEILSDSTDEEYPKEGTYIVVSKNREILLDSEDTENEEDY